MTTHKNVWNRGCEKMLVRCFGCCLLKTSLAYQNASSSRKSFTTESGSRRGMMESENPPVNSLRKKYSALSFTSADSYGPYVSSAGGSSSGNVGVAVVSSSYFNT